MAHTYRVCRYYMANLPRYIDCDTPLANIRNDKNCIEPLKDLNIIAQAARPDPIMADDLRGSAPLLTLCKFKPDPLGPLLAQDDYFLL